MLHMGVTPTVVLFVNHTGSWALWATHRVSYTSQTGSWALWWAMHELIQATEATNPRLLVILTSSAKMWMKNKTALCIQSCVSSEDVYWRSMGDGSAGLLVAPSYFCWPLSGLSKHHTLLLSTPFSLCLQWQLSNLCAKHTNSTLPLSVNFRSEFSVQTAPCPCQSISGLSSVSKLHLAPVSHSQVCAKVSKLHLALSSEFYAKCHNCILLLSTHLSSGLWAKCPC